MEQIIDKKQDKIRQVRMEFIDIFRNFSGRKRET